MLILRTKSALSDRVRLIEAMADVASQRRMPGPGHFAKFFFGRSVVAMVRAKLEPVGCRLLSWGQE
jgi:hypothetical protein